MKIKAQKLTTEAFAPFGSYFNIYEVDVQKQGNFSYYPDKTAALFDNSQMAGMSVCGINKQKMEVNLVEIHEHTEEVEFIIDGDCTMLAGERSGYKPDMEKFKAFHIPKGTLVRFKKMVWHFIPFPINKKRVMVLTVLPPFTYTNDAIVVTMDEAIEIEI